MLKRTLMINGLEKKLVVDPEETLANVLRNQLYLTGTKVGCNQGQCGCCSVILDSKVVRSCITKMKRVPENAGICTIEGIGRPGHLHALQLAWMVHGGAQCGFCTPGFLMNSYALLEKHDNPDDETIKEWLQSNLCRCTGYEGIREAVQYAIKNKNKVIFFMGFSVLD